MFANMKILSKNMSNVSQINWVFKLKLTLIKKEKPVFNKTGLITFNY